MSAVGEWKPFCSAEKFDALVESMVVENAPRVFAVVQEWGERYDGRIAAWGLAFEDHVEVVSASDSNRMRLAKPETAVRLFTVEHKQLSARLVWLPVAAPPADPTAVEVAGCQA